MYKYTYTIDGIHHSIKSIEPIRTADANGVIPISKSQNDICRTLKFLLREWIRLAKKHNIHWFCNGGTTLGAARDKGLIHYDNDLDLVVLFSDYSKIKQLRSDTCVVNVSESGFQFHLKNQLFPFIDLWLEAPNPKNQNEIILACPYVNGLCTYGANLVWPNEKYATQDVMNTVQLPFEGIMVNVPLNYEYYVKRQYGDDCLVRYVIQEHTDDHDMVNFMPSAKARIEFFEAWHRLNILAGLDKCPTIAGKESNVIGSLMSMELFTPKKGRTERKLELLRNYIHDKISHSNN